MIKTKLSLYQFQKKSTKIDLKNILTTHQYFKKIIHKLAL